MAELIKVNAPVRKPLFEGVQGENEARSIQFDVTPWVDELGDGVVTATAKRSQDSQPYPVTVTKDGNTVTWKPTSTDTAYAGVGSFQLEYTVDSVLAKTCIWSTMVAPSLDPAGDPPDPYDNWLAEMRQIAADALQSEQNADTSAKTSEAWAVGQRGGVDVPSTDPTYENNAKYWAEQSLANQYGAYIVKSASGQIASFNDGADDVLMKSVKVAIVPKQAGSGDPSPSNVRPITGWTTVNVYRGGHNYVEDLEVGAISSDGSEEATGSAKRTPYIPVTEGEKVVCDWKNGGAGYRYSRIALYDASKAFVSFAYNAVVGAGQSHTEVVTIPSGVAYLRFCSYNCPPQIIYKVIDNLDVTPVPLGQTVYGGEVNPISGELTISMAMVDMGSLSWLYRNQRFDAVLALGAKIPITSGGTPSICSIYPHDTHNYVGMADKSFICGPGYVSGGTCSLIVYDSTYGTDANAFKTAMNGVQLCYELATPTTIQLTPAQVATLLGTNNVWSDAGAVEVEYRADPTLAYAELEALILENI